jgi:hypothetical protein
MPPRDDISITMEADLAFGEPKMGEIEEYP